MSMDHGGNGSEDCISGGSSHSVSIEESLKHSNGLRSIADNGVQTGFGGMKNTRMGSVLTATIPSVLTLEFQEMIIRALLQSNPSLAGSSSDHIPNAGEGTLGMSTVKTEIVVPHSTWTESSFHKSEAKRKRKPEFMRTNAGEDSNSEENFPMPENATPEQRTLRTRRLNRWQGQRARDLTSNRKALRKLPYVIHVDCTSKPRGIHQHLWKSAVRGQCGRLDPTMDNINHHPRQVVDSMWHALEKEWEFEGFAHKAREMFKKSATKFMRNQKMQLKYKCLKSETGKKPDNVSDMYWKKIQHITKNYVKQEQTTASTVTRKTAKNVCAEALEIKREDSLTIEEEEVVGAQKISPPILDDAEENMNSLGKSTKQGKELEMFTGSSNDRPLLGGASASIAKDVESQIRILRRQLQWLENSRKTIQTQDIPEEELADVKKLTEGTGTESKVKKASQRMKENISPRQLADNKKLASHSRVSEKSPIKKQKGDSVNGGRKTMPVTGAGAAEGRTSLQELLDLDTTERMECGDIISVAAVLGRKEEDVGKGILMGFAGSRFARKVIPQGWCSVKLTSYTRSGAAEACPFPSGWKDQVKERTIQDAYGCTVLWPESLVHI